jgi:hypothetical protein
MAVLSRGANYHPLERSNFEYMLGLSGETSWVPNSSDKMIVKMLTHVHKVVNTCWCWHICKGGDSGVFEELKHLFSFTPKVRRSGEVVGVFLAEK